jgi:hypothetical protein
MSPAAPSTLASRKRHERDRGLLLLRNLTRGAVVGATALAGIFAGVAAENAKGRSVRSVRVVVARRASRAASPRPAPPPPTAPAVGAAAAAPSPAPQPQSVPAPVPAPTQAPPVAVSGGS